MLQTTLALLHLLLETISPDHQLTLKI